MVFFRQTQFKYKYNSVKSIRMIKNKIACKSKCYGFIEECDNTINDWAERPLIVLPTDISIVVVSNKNKIVRRFGRQTGKTNMYEY